MGLCSQDDGVGCPMTIKVVPGILESKKEVVEKKIGLVKEIVEQNIYVI